jgi:hypothetical protein
MTSICINSDNLLFVLIIGLIFFNSYRFNSFYPKLFSNDNNKQINNEIKELKKEIKKINLDKSVDTSVDTEREIRDLKVINDIRHPPERRVAKHEYLNHQMQKIVNIPTRGYPDDYQMMGILSRESDEKMLNLFGRQKYPGSDIWEYYVTDSTTNIPIKIPININNNRELLDDNSMINIPVFDNSKGKFKLTLYKFDTPRYLP